MRHLFAVVLICGTVSCAHDAGAKGRHTKMAPHVAAPAVASKGKHVLAAQAVAEVYVPSWTNIEVRPDGSATLRVDFKGKRSYFMSLLVDAKCETVTDLTAHKVIAMKPTPSLCAWIKNASPPLIDAVDACVASHGCDL